MRLNYHAPRWRPYLKLSFIWIAAFILVGAWTITSTSAAESFIGSVKTAQGRSFVQRASQSLPVTEGQHLLAQDVLHTGADGRLAFILRDGTRISLGSNSELKLDQFAYEPAESNYSLILDLTKGVFAYISGKIAKFSPESVKLQTPVGIIGVRGTHFAVALDAPRGGQ
jgi:hypothetical protein